MRQIRLTRVITNPTHGTFGTWVVDGQPMAVTLEPYKRGNAVSVSCIPTGQYIIKRRYSHKYEWHFIVEGVEGRSYILIHWGNLDDHTEGCILIAEEFGLLDGKWAVLSSKRGFDEFMRAMEGIQRATLTIVEAY